MNQSFIFGGQTGLTYDQIQKQRDIANELLRANMYTPQNVGEGLSAIGRALAAKAIDKRTTRADEANRQASQARRADAFGSIFGGGSGGAGAPFSPNVTPAAPPSPGAAVADDAMTALGKTPMRPFRDAIASIESDGSGGYAAVGPTHPQLGRALGRYQIMEANIGPWSREVLGREVTPEEFMANPQLQDAIFDGKFGGYVQQFGPEGAAQAWFAGPGGVGKMDRQDSLGTSVAEYTQKFSSALGGAPAPSVGMGNPATIQVIADLLADPYTPPGEKAMLEQAMAMQLQNMDPMRQMEMERARLELDQLRNPQPGFRNMTDEEERAAGLDTSGVYQQGADGSINTIQAPQAPTAQTRIVTGEEAAALGLDPKLRYNVTQGPEGVKADPIGGGTTVNRTDPAPPAGYRNVYNEQGLLIAQEPIPGSPAAAEAEAAARKGEAGNDAALTASDVVTTAANRALEAARQRALGGFGQGAVEMLPWTDSAEVRRNVDVLGSQATIETLTAMREASPTGGALGSVTEGELQILKQKSGALDPSSPTFERDLADYTLTLLRTIHGVETGNEVFRQTWKGAMPEGVGAAPKAEADTGEVPPGIDPDDWKYMTPEERALFK